MKLHMDSEIHKAMALVGLAWKELRGLNHPAPVAIIEEETPPRVDMDHEISIVDTSVDPSERPTVRVHAPLSAKVNNFTENKNSPVKKPSQGTPVKNAIDSVQAYDSPEHVHIRAAESVGKTPANSVRTGVTSKAGATDKVLEHLGKRASELQTQLALEEKEVSKKQAKSPTKTVSKAEAERRASVLTAEEEKLLVDVDADGELIVEDAHLLGKVCRILITSIAVLTVLSRSNF